jgi:threonine/homoserine/homoserine lactone efflux protein
MTGPIFFSLLDASLKHSYRGGLMMAAGFWLSDAMLLYVSWTKLSSLNKWLADPKTATILSIIGGSVLIIVSILGLWRSGQLMLVGKEVKIKKAWGGLLLRGFMVNTFNPFTFFLWPSLVAKVVSNGVNGSTDAMTYFIPLMGTIMFFDFIKIALSARISRWLSPFKIMWASRIMSIILLIAGLVIIYRSA